MKTTSLVFALAFLMAMFSCKQEKKTKTAQSAKNDSTQIAKKEFDFQPSDSLLFALHQLRNDTAMFNAIVGYYIVETQTGNVIAKHHQYTSLVPASTLKILTTGAALEMLGSGRRFKTTIQTGGTRQGTTLDGNIYIRGGGDPALGSKFFKKQNDNFIARWAEAIVSAGIDSVSGSVVADARIFDTDAPPPTWEWGEIGSDYATAAYGLSAYDNRFKIRVNRNLYGRRTVKTDPEMPYMQFENRLRAANTNKPMLYFLGDPYNSYRVVKGVMPKVRSQITIEGAIPNPPYLLAFQLQQALIKKGVRFGDTATTMRRLASFGKTPKHERKEITAELSPPVSGIVHFTNRNSNNLFAEHLIRHIGRKKYGRGDADAAAAALFEFWEKRIDTRGMYIFDGCGISRQNHLTPKQLVDVLLYMKKSKYFKPFYNSLAIAGKTGTMGNTCRNTPAHGNLRAKSGTMTRVKSYAGYVETESGKQLAFAFILNNYSCSNAEARRKLEKVMVKMAERQQ